MSPNPIGKKISILSNTTELFALLIQICNAAILNPDESEPNWEKAFNAAKFNSHESEPDRKQTFNSFKSDWNFCLFDPNLQCI